MESRSRLLITSYEILLCLAFSIGWVEGKFGGVIDRVLIAVLSTQLMLNTVGFHFS